MAVSQRPTEGASARSSALRPHTAGARLSVVLLSTGSLQELESAVSILASRLHRYSAQLVVVRADDDIAALEHVVEYPLATFVAAPGTATRAQLRDLGMTRASGDIVALRETGNVRDGAWLDSFSVSVTVVEEVVADWTRIGSLGETQLADVVQPASRQSDRPFPGDLSGPADVSLSPLPLA